MQVSRKPARFIAKAIITTTLVALGSFGALANAQAASAAKVRLSFSSALGPDTAVNKQAKWYMDEVAKRSGGQVQWDEFYAASLLSSVDTVSGVADGRADVAYFASVYDPSRFPLMDIGFVPMPGSNSVGNARAWRELMEENEALQAEARAAGVKVLIFNGVASTSNIATKQPQDDLAQFKGKKVRFVGPVTTAIQKLGANPASIAAEDIYEAMERGLIDGIGGTSIESVVGSGWHEVAPWMHYLPIGNYASSLGVIIGLNTWENLPADLQKVMMEVADDYYRQLPNILAASEKAACDQLLAAGGGTIVYDLSNPVAKDWVDGVGDSVFEVWRSNAQRSRVSAEAIASVEADYKQKLLAHANVPNYTPGEFLCSARSKRG
ncbi:TRAP transporter substrate-binding protein DctP [Alcaligenaceae bacterium]|nr:TRAP transporter substrate-binding protein DctP [Alcaligenaceae bacterium]